MFELYTRNRSPQELEIYDKIVAFLASYGMLVLFGLLILFTLKQFGKLVNITVGNLLIAVAAALMIDYLFGTNLQSYLYSGLKYVFDLLHNLK